MEEHSFEYTDEGYFYMLCVALFAVTILLLFTTISIADRYGMALHTLFILTVLTLIFLLYRKGIKKTGSATIFSDSLKLNLADFEQLIKLDDIKSYQIEYTVGCILRLKFRDGESLKLLASDSFCDPTGLKSFCSHFEKHINQDEVVETIHTSIETDQFSEPQPTPFPSSAGSISPEVEPSVEKTNRRIEKEKSIYEKKWMPYFLVGLTLAITAFIIVVLLGDKPAPVVIISTIGLVMYMWGAFLKAKSKS